MTDEERKHLEAYQKSASRIVNNSNEDINMKWKLYTERNNANNERDERDELLEEIKKQDRKVFNALMVIKEFCDPVTGAGNQWLGKVIRYLKLEDKIARDSIKSLYGLS